MGGHVEDKLFEPESFLSYHVGPECRTWVVSFAGKHLFPLSSFACSPHLKWKGIDSPMWVLILDFIGSQRWMLCAKNVAPMAVAQVSSFREQVVLGWSKATEELLQLRSILLFCLDCKICNSANEREVSLPFCLFTKHLFNTHVHPYIHSLK